MRMRVLSIIGFCAAASTLGCQQSSCLTFNDFLQQFPPAQEKFENVYDSEAEPNPHAGSFSLKKVRATKVADFGCYLRFLGDADADLAQFWTFEPVARLAASPSCISLVIKVYDMEYAQSANTYYLVNYSHEGEILSQRKLTNFSEDRLAPVYFQIAGHSVEIVTEQTVPQCYLLERVGIGPKGEWIHSLSDTLTAKELLALHPQLAAKLAARADRQDTDDSPAGKPSRKFRTLFEGSADLNLDGIPDKVLIREPDSLVLENEYVLFDQLIVSMSGSNGQPTENLENNHLIPASDETASLSANFAISQGKFSFEHTHGNEWYRFAFTYVPSLKALALDSIILGNADRKAQQIQTSTTLGRVPLAKFRYF